MIPVKTTATATIAIALACSARNEIVIGVINCRLTLGMRVTSVAAQWIPCLDGLQECKFAWPRPFISIGMLLTTTTTTVKRTGPSCLWQTASHTMEQLSWSSLPYLDQVSKWKHVFQLKKRAQTLNGWRLWSSKFGSHEMWLVAVVHVIGHKEEVSLLSTQKGDPRGSDVNLWHMYQTWLGDRGKKTCQSPFFWRSNAIFRVNETLAAIWIWNDAHCDPNRVIMALFWNVT